jgi:hypothetical protein
MAGNPGLLKPTRVRSFTSPAKEATMSKNTFQTETGSVSVTREGITVPKTAGGAFERAGRWASLVGQTRFIPRDEVFSVFVGDPKRKYMTGMRVAGVVATGGLGLLGPVKTRAKLIIGLSSGEVLEFDLLRSEAKHSDRISVTFSALGYPGSAG